MAAAMALRPSAYPRLDEAHSCPRRPSRTSSLEYPVQVVLRPRHKCASNVSHFAGSRAVALRSSAQACPRVADCWLARRDRRCRHQRRGHRHRCHAADGGRGQPGATFQRRSVRPPGRRCSDRSALRQDHQLSPEPWRRSPGNRALYLLAVGRMGWDPATKAYVQRRTAEGRSKPEIIRCLKRYIARELYPVLLAATSTLDCAESSSITGSA